MFDVKSRVWNQKNTRKARQKYIKNVKNTFSCHIKIACQNTCYLRNNYDKKYQHWFYYSRIYSFVSTMASKKNNARWLKHVPTRWKLVNIRNWCMEAKYPREIHDVARAVVLGPYLVPSVVSIYGTLMGKRPVTLVHLSTRRVRSPNYLFMVTCLTYVRLHKQCSKLLAYSIMGRLQSKCSM